MKIVELITDPSSQQLSMSRLCLPVVVAIDLGWVVSAVMGWPPKEALNPGISHAGGNYGGNLRGLWPFNGKDGRRDS